MRKQYAVFGLGNFGKHLALGLENLGCEVIVVDNSMEKIQEIADKVSYAMCANIEDPEVIKSLGARNLDGAVIAISENFGTSIMATIMAKEIGITSSGRDLLYEDQEPYLQEYADRAHENVLYRFRPDASREVRWYDYYRCSCGTDGFRGGDLLG